MTKIEEKNLDAYAEEIVKWESDHPEWNRSQMIATANHFFKFGVNLNLTWKDIRRIVVIADSLLENPDMRIAISNHGEEAYYTEVLKRYLEERK